MAVQEIGPRAASAAREAMVRDQIAARGVRDPLVLAAMRQVPREAFVRRELCSVAYEDGPLPIGHGQTISQPYVVAAMAELLELSGGERVLEVGTGSGYAAAVLSRIARQVFTVERVASLAEAARQRLYELGYDNVEVRHGDGALGWPERAPYDAIVVTAAGDEVPAALREQLALGGRLVMPVGHPWGQRLVRERRTEKGLTREMLLPVVFVPLLRGTGPDA